jgi:hypothetical protein
MELSSDEAISRHAQIEAAHICVIERDQSELLNKSLSQ